MLLNPDALVHAEIERRLELAGVNRPHPAPAAGRVRPTLRERFGRRFRAGRVVPLAAAGRHHLPIPPATSS